MRALWLGCLAVAITVSPAFADDYDLTGLMRPGLWEITSQEISGDGQAGPAETDEECVTLEDIEDFSSFASDEDQPFTVDEFVRDDENVRYRMSFASDDPQVDVSGSLSGDMEFDGPERYQGTMRLAMDFQGQAIESHTKVDARRIGDCSDGDEG